MFDIGWTEMAVIALLALIIIGPKDLPRVLRAMGQWVRKARSLTREFQSGLDDMIREADLDEAKKAVETGKNFNVKKAVKDSVDPTGELEEEGKSIEKDAQSGIGDDTASSGGGKPKQGAKASGGTAGQESSASGESDGDGGEEEKRATVVKHPMQQAPGNSVKPPAEGEAQSESGSGSSEGAEESSAKPTAKESSG
jgi:sec-independent protein translocase protein TatB